ncbi:MAG: 4Fe-4S dicluster domain-containing protein [Candidatus Thorarchaeota archaeon]|nr:MAG: 4Fe-4S dicluster domain-containing protein [Candidatus Thorarchaeota archaeon]
MTLFKDRAPSGLVPIDKHFRSRWSKRGSHEGHSVWKSESEHDGTIHGELVAVHIESCVGCMKCVDACPTIVFTKWVSDLETEVVDPSGERDCIFCMVCELVCPTEAILVSRDGGSQETLDSLLRSE